MFSQNFFDDAFYQMEHMKRRMLQDFERSLDRSFSGYGGYGLGSRDLGLGSRDLGLGSRDFGLSSRDPYLRPLRYEPEFLSLRRPEVLSLRIPERMPVDENTTFFAKYEVNDNGHVWKKTIEKKPGEEWKSNVEEYDQKPSLKEGQTQGSQIQGEQSKELKEGEAPKTLENKGRGTESMSRGSESMSRGSESMGRGTRSNPAEEKVEIEDMKTPSQGTSTHA